MLEDWQERIHLLSACSFPGIAATLSQYGVQWVHWSERGGIGVAALVNYHVGLFKLLNRFYCFWKRKDGRMIERNAQVAFGTGRLTRDYFHRIGIAPERCADLFYAIEALHDDEPFPELKDFAKGKKVFLYMGSLYHLKGIDLLLRAFAALDTTEWALILCGRDRSGGKYQKMAEQFGIADRVFFFGSCPSDKVAKVYAAGDVVVFPSRFDGWGMILSEGASLGMPLIGSDMAASSLEIIEPGRNGYLVKAGSLSSLTAAMRRYVDDPALIAEHGAAAKAKYFREFTPECNVGRLKHGLLKTKQKD
ncbi:MAG: glycosyltransferase family 4 protein [Victivallaceae bacterium]